MIVLGFDTATPSTVAAIEFEDGRVVGSRHDPAPDARPQHAARLLAFVHHAMQEAGVTWADIDRIAVGNGPGGFTGLRLGIATARALSQAQGIEVAPVSTLEALRTDEDVLPVIDARRREVFTLLPDPVAIAPADLAPKVAGLTLAGDGALRYRDLFEAAGATIAGHGHLVEPGRICRLGRLATPVERDALLPHYIRDPDAIPRR